MIRGTVVLDGADELDLVIIANNIEAIATERFVVEKMGTFVVK